ncbi:serine/threonine-protein kinase [Candidatus Uabimicrobium amorphum]|uniref:Protein kinase n=1 Tax=Uabimicrobium amorphum TaxID=2596890 RepID=A0A5S9IMV8_UABAM|nr:serine/threonine-protein kinase [Candidatus Uabimicrobium amorphum]BBM84356.1 protein kinase [Candidatus Uabimicrobium amorphum]
MKYITNSTKKTWKNYEILHEIGRGGMGVVYKAQQISPSRIVAIKFSKANTSENSGQRFMREIQIVAKLQHARIPEIYDAGIENNYRYIVMEYIAGKPLGTYLKDTDISLNQKIQLFIKICNIIHFAHRNGIVHRDLKPANILVQDDGEPVVIDFGIAKQIDNEEFDLTKTGDVVGTLHYMAPEQIAGKRSAIDHQADIYALGAILFELMTNQRMIKGSHIFEVMCFIQDGKILPPSRVMENVDKNLEIIWRNATALKKSHRYATMGEFIRDLKLHTKGQKVKHTYRPKSAFIVALVLLALTASFFLWKHQSEVEHTIELSSLEKQRLLSFEKLLHHINNDQLKKAGIIMRKLQPVSEYQGIQIAKAYSRIRKYDVAIHVLQNFPPTFDVAYQQALIFYQQQKYDKARQHFSQLLEQHPQDSKLNYYLGMCLFHEKLPQQALKFLLKAEQNFEEDVILLENIAAIYRHSDVDKAAEYLKKCLRLYPVTAKYTLMLGKISLEKRKYFEAFAYFKQTLASGNNQEALELLHKIPYEEPLLREMCYQLILYHSVSYQNIREPDLFEEIWREIEFTFRRDYVAWQGTYHNRDVSVHPFIKPMRDEKMRESTRNALWSLRYSKSFAKEVGQAQLNPKLSKRDKTFFINIYRKIQKTIAEEKLGRVYYSLAYMYRNHSWQHRGFVGIDKDFLHKQLHRETNTFLKYLLAEGYLNIFGFDAIIMTANDENVDPVTRMICCSVLRKHYMAVNIEVFAKLPQLRLPTKSGIFLQTLIAQAMYVPHKYRRQDTFKRYYNSKSIPDFEIEVLQYLMRQQSPKVKISAAISLGILVSDTHPQLSQKANKIIQLQMNKEGGLSRYAHFMFWKILPLSSRKKTLPIYKKSLLHKDTFIRKMALVNAEFFGEFISEVTEEIDQCVNVQEIRMYALFAWSLNKKLKANIFESPFYKKWFPQLSPLEKTTIIISRLYRFSFDMRSFSTRNQQNITKAMKFFDILKRELITDKLPPQSRCMISYVLSLMKVHPSLDQLKKIKDPKLLAYYLHQLKQEINIGVQSALLIFLNAKNAKERQGIAAHFIENNHSKIQKFAISSYVACAAPAEQIKIYHRALDAHMDYQKGVALGLYYSLVNSCITESNFKESLGYNFFSGKPLSTVTNRRFSEMKQYVANVTPQKSKKLQALLELACTLDPKSSVYKFSKAYLFPNKNSIQLIKEAIDLNKNGEAGNQLDIYTLKLVQVCLEEQQTQTALDCLSQHRVSFLATYIAAAYRKLHKYEIAKRIYEKYFLTNVGYTNILPLRHNDYNEMVSLYFLQKQPETGKYLLDYLYELIRRNSWHKEKIDKQDFIEDIKSKYPIIKKNWK